MSAFKATKRSSNAKNNTTSSTGGFKSTKYKGFDETMVYEWETANRQSLDILNDYNNRINKSEWLDEEDRKKYRSALDSYIETSNYLRGINKTFGEGYTDEDEQKWADSIASMNAAYDSTEKYYSQWIDEKDYKGQRDGWFQKSNLFDDGYQFGDVTKTIGATITDAAQHVGAGIVGMGEAALDALMTIAPYVAQGQYYANGGGYNLQADQAFDQSIETSKKGVSEFVAKDLYDEEAVAKAIIADPVKALTKIDAETDSVFGAKTDSLGQSAGQLVGTAGLQAVGVPWWLTTGVTSLGSESQNALNQGATLDEAAFSGLVSAGAEILTEKISGGISFGGKTLDDLLPSLTSKISSKAVRTLLDLGIDIVGEGGEEILSGFMSAIGQKLTYASDKEMSELFSSEDALDSFIGGAVLGFGGSVVGNVKQKIASNKQAVDIYGSGADLVAEALDIDPNNTYAQKMQGKVNNGKSLSGGQINRLVAANESALVSQDKGKIKDAVEAQLSKYGETGDIGKIAEVITKIRSGEKITNAERDILVSSKYGRRVSTEMNRDVAKAGTHNSSWVEDIGTERIGADIYNRDGERSTHLPDGKVKTNIIPPDDEENAIENSENAVKVEQSYDIGGAVAEAMKTVPATENATVIGNATEGKIAASENAKVTIEKEGKVVEVKPQKIASLESDEMTIELEGGEVVDASEVDFGDSGVGLVYQAAKDMASRVGGFSIDTANVFVRGYNAVSGVSAGEYVNGWISSYKLGAQNTPISALASNAVTSKLSEAQRKTAYNFGRAFGNEPVATSEKRATSKKEGKVYFDGAKYGKTLNERQRASLKALNFIAKSLGIDIHIFESPTVNGKRKGENGWYDPSDRSIHIDLYAGAEAEALMIFTAAHELTHHIREVLPDKFNVLADAIFEEYTKRYGSHAMEHLVDEKKTVLKEKGRITEDMSDEEAYDLAYEEVIADCCETLLVDSNAIEALSKNIYAKDKGLWETIKNFIAKLVARIKAAFGGVEPDSEEGLGFRALGEGAERIKKLWVEAIVEASGIESGAKNDVGDVVDVVEDGQFYEIRGEAAVRMSKELELTLTHKTVDGKKVPMVGFPLRYFDTYSKKAAKKGISLQIDSDIIKKDVANKDTLFNLRAAEKHKLQLEEQYTKDASISLNTLMQRYNKIISIWENLGGELNSKFLKEWDSKIGKDRAFTVFKAQAGYKYNVELSSMCKKGVPLFEAIDTIVKQEVMKELDTEVLGKEEKEILYDILKDHNFEIPCAICYVEQARQREGVIIDAFLNGKVEKNSKGQTTTFKLGWNEVLKSIEKEMKANGVDYTFAAVDRSIATDKYSPADITMDEATQEAFYNALKKIANKEIARYNKAKNKNRKLVTSVTPAAIKEVFKGTLPSNLKIFKVLFTDTTSRFTIKDDLLYSSMTTHNLANSHNALYSLFNSQGGVSGYKTKQGTVVYWGDILGKKWTPSKVRDEGGIRNQSNSDFQMYTLLDQAQMYIDFTAKGYYLQAYTKVLAELKLFGLSRGKINASLIPAVYEYKNPDGTVDVETTREYAGLDANGELLFDDFEGINHAEAFMLLEDAEYSKSLGGICIGYSDNHILKLLDDQRVQQIIGFHDKTDDPDKRYRGAKYSKNYNGLNEAVKFDKDGKPTTVHIGFNPYVRKAEKKFKYDAETETYAGEIVYNGKTYVADDIPKLAADMYLDMCEEKGYDPAYKMFAFHENYYKLLADFSLYDSEGHYAPHRKVAFNMPDSVPYLDSNGNKKYMPTKDYIKAELKKELKVRDSISEALADTSENGIIPQFKKAVNEAKKSRKKASDRASQKASLSDRDSLGNELSKEQQEFFKDSKARDEDGNLYVLYHGTKVNHRIDEFLTTEAWRTGLWLSTDHATAVAFAGTKNAKLFTKENSSTNNGGGGVYELYANLKNPFIVDAQGRRYWEIPRPAAMGKGAAVSGEEINAFAFKNNYDGVIINDVVEGSNRLGTDVVVFYPNQVKYTDNLTPTEGNDIRYSDRAEKKASYAPTFYSHMGKVIDDVKLEKMGTSSILNHLKNRGVKDEEIKWSGIETFLEGKKSVTKAELQEFVAGSQLVIEEEMSGRDIELRYDHSADSYTVFDGDGDIIDTYTYDADRGGYASENDDEVYEYASDLEKEMRYIHGIENAPRHSEYKLEGGTNYRELVFKMPNSTYSNNAMRAHWGQDAEGILVHARIQDFDVNGKKMLFIEEIQSDWHNEGAKDGYVDSKEEARIEKLKAKAEEAFFKVEDYSTEVTGMAGEWDTIEQTDKGAKLIREYDDAQVAYNNAMNALVKKIPDAPFRDNYHEYVLKRLLRMAAEEGYDAIGWTPSEIQSERWSEEFAEAYRIEYDQEMPKFLRKYGKKWGATVGKTSLEKGWAKANESYIASQKEYIAGWQESLAKAESDSEADFIREQIKYHEQEIKNAEVDGETVWSMDITGSMKESVLYEGQVLYQHRNSNGMKPRTLLANALETAAQNDIEREKLKQYKEKIDLINSEEQKLNELRAQIKELSFKKGARDTEAIKSLQFEANQTANRINTYDKQLLNLESTKALKGVLEREKAMLRKRIEQKAEQRRKEDLTKAKERAAKTERELMNRYQESRQRATESRNKTAMRHKIKDIVSELNTLLLNPTAKKHIKEELRKEVAGALSAINMDTVGADERVAKYNALIARENDPDIIDELVKTRDNIQLQGDSLKEKLNNLQMAYEKIKNTEDIELNLAYQEVIQNSIKAVSEKVGNTSIRNMTLEQLEMVYDLFKMIRHTIRDANKSFKAKKGETIMQMAEAVNDQVRTVGGQPYKRNAISAAAQRAVWTFLKPFVAFRTIGSVTLTNLYKNLRAGEDTFYGDVREAQEFIEAQYEKHGYKSWDMKKTKTFTAKSGKTFELTLEQMMSLYAYYKRDQAHDHIIEGGIVFEDAVITEKNKWGVPIKYEVTTKDAFNLSEETFAEIANSLTAEQKAFVDAMQDYLSSTMGEKGNEVSMQLLGVKLFKEKFYLPIKSSQYYMNFKAEEAGEVKLKSPAFSKETVKHANNPIVVHNFTDLWAEHINDMSMYHAFVLALEDFTRVYNYKTKTDDKVETMDTKATLETAYPGVTNYINKFLKDMNGGVRGETVGWAETLTSLSKKGAVLGSASVVIQQPSAVMRAMAMVDPKYFVTTAHKSVNLAKHKQDWEELKKYAPIAGIKEMGRFDVGMGQGTVDWIKSNKTALNKVEDGLSAAPAYMDEVTWVSIWNAVKRETANKNPKLETSSEEFLKLAGERFTDVISLTQVYDSVFSRSDLMRNKSVVAKWLTAFMAEPSTTLNMLWDSWVQAKRTGGFKAYAKATTTTGGAIMASMVLNAALKSIVTAMRDDDEDETYAEKYLEHFVGDLKDSLNPLTLIPVVKDIVSIFKGYDVERMDMALFSDLKKALDAFDSDSKTVYEKWSGLVGAISAFFGVPIKNVERDIRGLINTFFGKTEDTTVTGILNAIEEGWTGKDNSNGKQLYDAYLKGDAEQIERVKGRFEDENAANTALRKALRENDPRIKEAAEAFIKGDYNKYNSLREEIISEGKFSGQIVTDALKAEYRYLKEKAEEGR